MTIPQARRAAFISLGFGTFACGLVLCAEAVMIAIHGVAIPWWSCFVLVLASGVSVSLGGVSVMIAHAPR